ncbi:unnamed protein product [Urochloa humidicola]
MMGCRLLDQYYDKEHRARLIEQNKELHVLRPRTHDGFQVMKYDHRYGPLLQHANLHVVANLVRHGMPTFNPAALTALIDRWRPETHSFHLPCGEMTITLEDVAMMLGLPIRGRPVIGAAISAGWRGRVEEFLGTAPPVPEEEGSRGRVSGVPLRWLRDTFGTCPEDADEATLTYHCRAWVLHLFGTVLFPDATGDSASWMYIHCLRNWNDAGGYSWGSAVLGFLYMQLCEACRRHARTSTQAGCTYLLQLWMWSRLPVGRPRVMAPRRWLPVGVEQLAPTVAYLWDNVSSPYAITTRAYVEYSNELDALSPSMVTWQPYRRVEVHALPLSNMCTRDQDLWRMTCPLICFYAVEIHLPHRVARQFGLQQSWPPEEISTSIDLHKFDRVRQRKVTDFVHHHREMIEWWNKLEQNVKNGDGPHSNANFRAYLDWFQSATRCKFRQKWTTDDYADIASSDDDDTRYDKMCREGTQVEIAPILDRAGTSVRQSVEDIANALRYPPDEPGNEGRMRVVLERLHRRLCRVAARCGCRTQVLTDVQTIAASHHSSDLHASSSRGIACQSAMESSSKTPTFNDDDQEDEEEVEEQEDEEQQPEYDEIGMSQLPDAPSSTQPPQ